MKKSGKRMIACIVLLVIAAGLGLAAAYVSLHSEGGKNTYIPLEATESYDISLLGNGILLYSGTEAAYYNTDFEKKWSLVKNSEKAAWASNDTFASLLDYINNEVVVFQKGGQSASIKTDGTLYTAKVGANGYIAVVSDEQGYKNKVMVYSPAGELLYDWKTSGKYIIDADISPKSDGVVMTALELDASGVTGSIIFAPLSGETPQVVYEAPGALLSTVKCQSNGDYTVVGDTQVLRFKKNHDLRWSKSFEGQTLQHAEISDSYVVLALVGAGTTTVQTCDRHGNVRGSFSVSDRISQLSSYGGFTAVGCGGELLLLNAKCQQIGVLPLPQDVRDIHLFPNKNKILMVTAVSAYTESF